MIYSLYLSITIKHIHESHYEPPVFLQESILMLFSIMSHDAKAAGGSFYVFFFPLAM